MKKIFTLFLLAAVPALFYAQTQRIVLIEEGSNASCGPCAAQNPAFHALMSPNEDAGKVITLKYQWYFPGFDPMHNHNVAEANGRFDAYYGQSGVPTAMIDGTVPTFGGNPYDGAPAGFSQQMIDDRYAITSPFSINVDAQMSEDFTTIDVDVDVTAEEAITNNSNMKVRIAVVEKQISFDTAPGSNGETEFYSIMKKFLPNHNGLDLQATFTDGQSVSFSESWTHANVYDMAELAVVVFVQDDDTKEVYQVAKSDVQFTVSESVAVSAQGGNAVGAEYANQAICEYRIAPKVDIRNEGNDALTDLEIQYSVNGGYTHSYDWSGSLATLNTETVTLPEVAFFHDAMGSNTVDITIVNPNGTTDPDATDNTVQLVFSEAANVGATIDMEINHDQYGSEITWELVNSAGTTLYSGGPYADAAGTATETFSLTASDCYEFKLYDSYGDGQIGGASGLTLTDVTNTTDVIANYADYGSEGRVRFGFEKSSSVLVPDSTEVDPSLIASAINNTDLVNTFSVYPNPTSDILNVEVKTNSIVEMTVEMVDVLGRVIATTNVENEIATFNTSNINTGVYFVNVMENGKSVATSTVLVK